MIKTHDFDVVIYKASRIYGEQKSLSVIRW